MSKEGLPVLEDTLDASGLSVAVVTARWNTEICERMRRNAVAAAREAPAVQCIGGRVLARDPNNDVRRGGSPGGLWLWRCYCSRDGAVPMKVVPPAYARH